MHGGGKIRHAGQRFMEKMRPTGNEVKAANGGADIFLVIAPVHEHAGWYSGHPPLCPHPRMRSAPRSNLSHAMRSMSVLFLYGLRPGNMERVKGIQRVCNTMILFFSRGLVLLQ